MERACWHVAHLDRLRRNLQWTEKWGVCDLYSLSGHAERWFDERMRLSVGDRVRFCCKGSIVAEGTIASRPRERTSEDPTVWHSGFPSVVTIERVSFVTQKMCDCYRANPRFGSHRLSGRGPCS